MSQNISSVLHETRIFPPQPGSALGFSKWHVGSIEEYRELHKRSVDDPEGFWGEEAKRMAWFKPYHKVLKWNAPDAKWFVGGQTNACYNCVDRHVQAGFGD